MQARKLGKSGLSVSEVGLGCWQLGGDFGPIEASKVEGVIESALESGINFFDTADVYGGGASETYIGQHLSSQPIVIATKYGRGGDCFPDGYSLSNMRDSIKRSQDRLQRDCLDLLQLHCIPGDIIKRGEVFDWLRTIQQEGHIRHFGASVETVEEALACLEQDDLTSLQVICNIFRQNVLEELFPRAQEQDVGIIARLPLASGMLSGKFTAETTFAETDHRSYNRDGQAFSVGETFAGIPFDKGLELVKMLEEMLPDGYTMAQMAMRWLLDQPAISTIIPGASSAKQVRENARVSDLPPLSQDLHDRLARFYKQEAVQHVRGVY